MQRSVIVLLFVCVVAFMVATSPACNVFNDLGNAWVNAEGTGGANSCDPMPMDPGGAGGGFGGAGGGAFGGSGVGVGGSGVGAGVGGGSSGPSTAASSGDPSTGAGGGFGAKLPPHDWRRRFGHDTFGFCGGPCAGQCPSLSGGINGFSRSVFKFAVIIPDNGEGKGGGWQQATATLDFYRWTTTILPESWTCTITVGMPMRTAVFGPISAQRAANMTATVATTASFEVTNNTPNLPPRRLLCCLQGSDGKRIRGTTVPGTRRKDDAVKHSIKDLFTVVYRHYPRGIPSDDPRYAQSEEYQRLVAARKAAGAASEPWRAMLQRLDERFPECTVQDGSLHLPTGGLDAGYCATLYRSTSPPGEHGRSVRFRVSFLVSYYVVFGFRLIDEGSEETGDGPVWFDTDTHYFGAKFGGAPDVAAVTRAMDAGDVPIWFEGDTCYFGEKFRGTAAVAGIKPDKLPRVSRRRMHHSFTPAPEDQVYWDAVSREIETTFGYDPMPLDVVRTVVPDVMTNMRLFGQATLCDCLMSDSWS
jgi:hypothetical protein